MFEKKEGKMKKSFFIGLTVSIMVLSGCATKYDTEKSFWTGNTGFSQTQLGTDVWQIDFTGNTYTDRATTKKYTLKKAAQIALKEGYSFFKVMQGETNKDITGANAVGGYGGLWGAGSTYNDSKTLTTMTIKLLKTKEGVDGMVYDATFLVNSKIE